MNYIVLRRSLLPPSSLTPVPLPPAQAFHRYSQVSAFIWGCRMRLGPPCAFAGLLPPCRFTPYLSLLCSCWPFLLPCQSDPYCPATSGLLCKLPAPKVSLSILCKKTSRLHSQTRVPKRLVIVSSASSLGPTWSLGVAEKAPEGWGGRSDGAGRELGLWEVQGMHYNILCSIGPQSLCSCLLRGSVSLIGLQGCRREGC